MAPAIQLVILMHVCSIVTISNTHPLPKFSSIIVFGDSTVDTGNNNYINTLAKGNNLPYGKDSPGHLPTGRFCNGKIVSDFLASILHIKDSVPPYLNPNLSNEELLTGVCFASGGSGIDEITAATFNVISMSKQIEYFKDYVAKLKHIAGENETKKILEDALVVIAVGSNDFILNFYDLPNGRVGFSINQYQNYLLDRLQTFIKDLYDHGCRNFGVAGLPPLGCIPFQITIKFQKGRKCVEDENYDSVQYNRKLENRLAQLQPTLPGSRIVYADIYYPALNLINHPKDFGIEVTNVGCCGIGEVEVTPFCNEHTPLCDDASKYAFWDAFHFTEVSYFYLAKFMEIEVLPHFN